MHEMAEDIHGKTDCLFKLRPEYRQKFSSSLSKAKDRAIPLIKYSVKESNTSCPSMPSVLEEEL